MIPLWMFPVATVCGNTMILKPSEKDPGATMILAKLAKEAGLPDGVLQVRTLLSLLLPSTSPSPSISYFLFFISHFKKIVFFYQYFIQHFLFRFLITV